MALITKPALRFEADKARSMWRNWVLLALATTLSTLPLVAATIYYRDNELGSTPEPLSEFDAVALSNSQLINFGAMLLALLGILLVGYDLRGRVAQGTALAFPRRLESYRAKLAIGGGIAAVFAGILVPTCFALTQSLLGEPHAVDLGDTGVLRSLVGAFLALVLVTLFAMGLASTLRSTALAIGILMPLMFLISTVLRNLPLDVISTLAEFLPDQAGGRMAQAHTPSDATLNPYTAALVLAGWAAVAVVAGSVRTARAELTSE